MATILLAWELGAGAGHCVKLAPIARRLIDRGHDVWLAVRDLVTAKHIFGSLPIRYLQAPFQLGKPPRPIRWPRSLAQVLHNTGFGDPEYLEVLTDAWRNLLAAVGADLLVCDHAPTALLAGRWTPQRRAIVGTGFEIPPSVAPLPDLHYWSAEQASPKDLAPAEAAVLGRSRPLHGSGALTSQYRCPPCGRP